MKDKTALENEGRMPALVALDLVGLRPILDSSGTTLPQDGRLVPGRRPECARRPNFDHPCRLNIDQGWKPVSIEASCG
jgi:hypothetical protein